MVVETVLTGLHLQQTAGIEQQPTYSQGIICRPVCVPTHLRQIGNLPREIEL